MNPEWIERAGWCGNENKSGTNTYVPSVPKWCSAIVLTSPRLYPNLGNSKFVPAPREQKRGFPLSVQQQAALQEPVSLSTIFLVFLKVGAFTFGGGYAMLPIIQREVVTRRNWVDRTLFVDIIVIAQSLPGAIALNSAIQIGMRLRGIPGGLLAALGIIVPSVAVILALAAFFLPVFQDNIYLQALFYGLRPAVVALIAAAVVGLGRDIFSHWKELALAATLLAAALLFKIHPIIILLAGGTAGLLLFKEKEE